MSLSLVKVILFGTLGDTPMVKATKGGSKMAGLSVYTTCGVDDERRRRAARVKEWHRVMITAERLVEVAEIQLRKGDQIFLEGGLETRYWRDSLYELRSLTNIVLSQETHQLSRVSDARFWTDPSGQDRVASEVDWSGAHGELVPSDDQGSTAEDAAAYAREIDAFDPDRIGREAATGEVASVIL
ncbi:MAG: single-stranded DNA-binding protein [Alphaproteobacteria bacterium]|nr:single-stranded DNA-binding protein [Alphaproteobacteria bacterium]